MVPSVTISAEDMKLLTEQHWRRLGITQTFDRLLVHAAATNPASAEEVRDFAGKSMGEAAARFWQMSFPDTRKDLCRRAVLAEAEGILGLEPAFAERVTRMFDELKSGQSHVAPTSGLTVEEVVARQKARADRDQPAPKAKPRPRAASTPNRTRRADATPKTRSAERPQPTLARPAAPAPLPVRGLPPTKLFTNKRLNTMLDRLDAGALLRSQLASRLALGATDLLAFLKGTDGLELTRETRGDMVELHFGGRELAKLSGGDRRMGLIQAVKSLRANAEEVEEA